MTQKYYFVLFFSCFLFWQLKATAVEEEEEEEEETSSVIVVEARSNYCDPSIMKKRIAGARDSRLSVMDELKLNHTHFYGNVIMGDVGSAEIQDLDPANRKFKIVGSYFSCAPSECEALKNQYPDLNFMEYHGDISTPHPSNDYYSVFAEVEYSQMYDGRHRNFYVPCPRATCSGFSLETKSGNILYLVIHIGGRIEKRLYVNISKPGAMTNRPSDEGKLTRKCSN